MKKIVKVVNELTKGWMLTEGVDFDVQEDEISFIDGYYDFKIIADNDCDEYILNIWDLRDEYSADGVHYEHIKDLKDVVYKWNVMINTYFKRSEEMFLSLCQI